MDERGPDNIDANYDPYMEVIDVSPNILSLQAATIMGMCATVVIGNSLICLLGNGISKFSNWTNMVLLQVTVLNAFTALLSMPLMTAAILESRWRYGDSLCRGTGTLTFVFIILAIVGIVVVLFHRTFSLICCCNDDKGTKIAHWLFLVSLFLIGSILGLAVLVEWDVLLRNPTRQFCRMANSPSRVGYRLFYGGFSVLSCIIVMMLFSQSKQDVHNSVQFYTEDNR